MIHKSSFRCLVRPGAYITSFYANSVGTRDLPVSVRRRDLIGKLDSSCRYLLRHEHSQVIVPAENKVPWLLITQALKLMETHEVGGLRCDEAVIEHGECQARFLV